MKTKAFTFVEVMICVVIIGMLTAMAIPAFSNIRPRPPGKPKESRYISTQIHEGHLFAVYGNGSAMLHHPGCPCLAVEAPKGAAK